jgi:hypothetical protein
MGDSIEDRLLAEMRKISNAQTREILDFLRSATVMNRQAAFDAIAIVNAKVSRLEAAILSAAHEGESPGEG